MGQLLIFGLLFDCIAAEARRFFPLLVKEITENIPKEYLIFEGVFTYRMYHLSPIELEHIDYNDFGICVVVPLGSSFTGGNLRFNYLNIE